MSIAQAIQLIKGGSSKWIHDTFPEYWQFRWQVKCAGFSVSVSQLDKTIRYIKTPQPSLRDLSTLHSGPKVETLG